MTARPGPAGLLHDPIVTRDSRARTRWSGTAVAVTLVLGAVAVVACALFARAASGAPDHHPNAVQMERVAYHAMALQIALVMIVAPAVGAGTIAEERARGTLDLLLVSELSPWSVVRAKVVATVSYVMLFAAAALPLYAAIFLNAGLSLGALALAEIVTFTAALAAGSLGVFFSALCRCPFMAAVAAVGLCLASCLDVVVGGVVPAPGTGLPQTRQMLFEGASAVRADPGRYATADDEPGARLVHPARIVNPLYAVHQLVAEPAASVPLSQIVGPLVPGGDNRTPRGFRSKPWQLAGLAQVAFSALLLFLATRIVARTIES